VFSLSSFTSGEICVTFFLHLSVQFKKLFVFFFYFQEFFLLLWSYFISALSLFWYATSFLLPLFILVSFYLFIYLLVCFFVVLGFEFTLHLPVKDSITWATTPVLFALSYFLDRILLFTQAGWPGTVILLPIPPI
jgi:hypothetical protein